MPGGHLLGPMEVPSPPFALFKAHKTLPRSNTRTHDRRLSYPVALKPDHGHATETLSPASSARIRSWIPVPFSARAALDKELPPTPPIISMDHEDGSWRDGSAVASYVAVANQTSSVHDVVTPRVQQSPPTPETTPPRTAHTRGLPLALRDPSVRTDSFKTARENASSDGDDIPVPFPSVRPAQDKWLSPSMEARPKRIGLGLGLESDDEDNPTSGTTPTNSLKNSDSARVRRLQQRAGKREENHEAAGSGDSSGGSPLPNHMVALGPRMSEQTTPRSEDIGEGAGSPVLRSRSLRQRVRKAQHNRSPSVEKFAQEIDWPLGEELDLDARLREVDNRRFSQLSASSSVVEAMVIDTQPRRRQTLRHTGKVSDFKSDGSRVSSSHSSVTVSDSVFRRRLPRNSCSPDRGRRRSVATDASGSAASTRAKVQPGGVPVHISPH